MRRHKPEVLARAEAYSKQKPKANTSSNGVYHFAMFHGGRSVPYGGTKEEQRTNATKKGKYGALTDTLCALTEGKLFFGHKRGYFKEKHNQVHEAVANLTAMRYTHNALMKRIVGALAEDVETLLEAYAGEEQNGEMR